MNLSAPNNLRFRWSAGAVFLLLTLLPRSAHPETPGELMLLNGNTVPGWMQRIDGENVIWKARGGQIGSLPIASVQNMRLQPSPEYRQAVETLKSGPDAEALRVLEGYADRTDPANYYPVPGNLASLATRALFDHHRTWGQPEEAAAWAAVHDPGLLPQTSAPPLLDLYRALASVPTDDFFAAAAEKQRSAEAPLRFEIEFLKGVAHELRGEYREALAGYARVYSPSGGVLNPHGEFAIQRSIQLLKALPPGTIPDSDSMIEPLRQIKELLYTLR